MGGQTPEYLRWNGILPHISPMGGQRKLACGRGLDKPSAKSFRLQQLLCAKLDLYRDAFRESNRRTMVRGSSKARIFGGWKCLSSLSRRSRRWRTILYAYQTRGRAAPAHCCLVARQSRSCQNPGVGPGKPFSLLLR
ncbi:unnamed protein product [Leptidea sinapis]|uniref:Uncharacterized protein n=1 Tax=Leptidea sinapis TaxID=189913 RepID=A0A5E4PY30_9NEOP|nr:unnamed protein product [Leptidea sinapis]